MIRVIFSSSSNLSKLSNYQKKKEKKIHNTAITSSNKIKIFEYFIRKLTLYFVKLYYTSISINRIAYKNKQFQETFDPLCGT